MCLLKRDSLFKEYFAIKKSKVVINGWQDLNALFAKGIFTHYSYILIINPNQASMTRNNLLINIPINAI